MEELERLQAEQSKLGEVRRVAWQEVESGVMDWARDKIGGEHLMARLRDYRRALHAHEAACQRTGEVWKRELDAAVAELRESVARGPQPAGS